MSNIIVNGSYGQRMAKPLPFSLDAGTDFVLGEIPISLGTTSADIAIHFGAWQRNFVKSETIPGLMVDPSAFELAKVGSWSEIVCTLKDLGANRITLLIDEDNETSRRLSPRFYDKTNRESFARQISRVVETISKNLECLMSLTIEELCPGGLDPTDGIELAQFFVDAGAKGIIGSGGSMDFPMLKNRRLTRQKGDRLLNIESWPETWMSSALWLVDSVKVPIFAQGQFENVARVRIAAQTLGFAGLVNISVKDPSSP